MTRGAIIQAAQSLYNEETGDFITTVYLGARFQELKDYVERRTQCYRINSDFNLTDSTRTYILPAGLLSVRRKGGMFIKSYGFIEHVDLADLKASMPLTWDTTESLYPTCWYMADEMMTAADVTNWALGFYPVPSTTVANGATLSGFGTSAQVAFDTPATPETDAKFLPWPSPFHDGMKWGLCWMAAIRDSDPELKTARREMRFKGEFEQWLADFRAASADSRIAGASVQIGGGVGQPLSEEGPIMVVNI